ncbi:TonB-dependent receptor [Catenovulum maritimum]|uniref:TonB-dependent receptor n=1 Tax=Catenovulum maritimum TaxID=1513271 RepID=A0A0J8JIG2_9ALTE|nr:TonB-dependent receptor [Catenovulum maritimum]KMT64246.1 TonB-dependent receptor [Catenovulum maritimum]
MYSKSAIASAVFTALLTQPVLAAEQDTQEDVEVIQVKGIRGSLNQALNNKRFNTQIVDSIVAEDIGKFPDNNVVEALQRVTGVQVTGRGGGEASTVSIRGLNDVHTTVNGRDVFTGTGRAVALQDIPASLLSNVTVYKTRSASQTERGIAGSIDIETNRPFKFSGSKVVLAARGIYADQSKKIDPALSALASNRWETDLGEFGALVNVSYVETNYRDDGLVAGAAFPFFTSEAPFGHQPYKIMNYNGSNEFWDAGRGATNGLPSEAGSTLSVDGQEIPYYIARDAVFGTVGEANRKRPAASVSLQWAVNDELELLAEGFYTGYRQELQNSLWFTNVFEEDGNNGNLIIDAPILIEGTNIIKERQVYAPNSFQSGDATTGKTDSYLFALGAKWMPTLDLTINAELIAQNSTFEGDFFAMRFDRKAYGLDVDFNHSGGVPGLHFWDNPETSIDESDLADPANWKTGTVYDNGGKQDGDSITLKVDGEYFFNNIIDKVRFGVKLEQRNALNYQREQNKTKVLPIPDMIQALTEEGVDNAGEFVKTVDEYMFGTADIFDSYSVANGLFMIDNAAAVRSIYEYEKNQYTNTFNVSEDSMAAYVTADYKLGDINGEIGVRYVKYKQNMEFLDFDDNDGYGVSEQSEVLPSFTLNWNITDDLVGRVAYTQTLRMPEYNALSPLQFWFDPLTEGVTYGTGSGGNPDLRPTKSANYDLSLEWYFSPGSSLYGAVFQRDIEGLVIGGRKVVRRVGNDDVERDYILSAPVNASDGELSGLEIGLVYVPENLPETLDGIGFQASYTELDSSQTVQDFNELGEVTAVIDSKMSGVSDSSYSLVAFYEKEDFDMRLSYVWREAFYSGDEGPNFANPIQFWSKPEQSLDFQFSYDVSDELTLTFDATNILDDRFQNHYGKGNVDTFNFATNIFSRTFALGARYSF